jgi:hypothetical protein
MICDECETVAHCLKNGCVPKQPSKDEALKLALEALEKLFGIPDKWTGEGGGDVAVWRLGGSYRAQQAITAIKQALADSALDRMAENARELGLDYAPVQEPVAVVDGNTSDGYHTFNELYEFRKAYNAALFNEWAAVGKCSVHKSWRHHDGELCFGGGWFIVVAVLPQGQISNHYEAKDWDLFAVPEVERALFEFDGHTGADVVERLKAYTTPPAQPAPVQEPVVWKNAAIRLGEELSSVGPDGYYDMTAEQWLDWAMDQHPQGKNSLPAQRTWVGLTRWEIDAKLKEKNGI